MASSVEGVIQEIEEAAKSEYLPIIGREKGEFLAGLVREHRPCAIVEIGVMVGYATLFLARDLAEGCRLIGIEISAELAARAEENIAAAGLSGRAEVRRGDASEALGHVYGPIGMVVLDGARSLYKNHLRMLEPKLHDGSVIVANITSERRETFEQYLDYVRNDPRYTSEFHQFGEDGLEVSRFTPGN